MGLGLPVDLEAPVIKVTHILLQDGSKFEIDEDDNKLLIGPGILVGSGAVLCGEVLDNEHVETIFVEEIGSNAELINGKKPSWSTSVNPAKNLNGWQEWSIVLDGIKGGERVITITAHDKPKNIGPSSVKQLTLLVDVDPPFVKSIKIERQAGIQVDLLPRTMLEEMDENLFENIDYFQNESFIIRASIEHDFSLSDVTLNFVNEAGENVFADDLQRKPGTNVYTPVWEITSEMLIEENPALASGKHYLNVVVKATAKAGHSGSNDYLTNHFYSMCWYPESDYPRVFPNKEYIEDDVVVVQKNSIIPIKVFDDDSLAEIYAGIIPLSNWANIVSSDALDREKAIYLFNQNYGSGDFPFNNQRLKFTIRNNTVALEVKEDAGEYRLVVYAKDKEVDGVWSQKVFNFRVEDEAPKLSDLISITCDKADGAYKKDVEFTFRLIFDGKVKLTSTESAYIKIAGGGTDNIGDESGKMYITALDPSLDDGSTFFLEAKWTVPEGIYFDPVIINSIDLTGVERAASGIEDPSDRPFTRPSDIEQINDTRKKYNEERKGLKAMSINPTVTGGEAFVNGIVNINGPASSRKSILTINFSHPVFAEKGQITIRPVAVSGGTTNTNYLVPPVLTNDEFSKINSALTPEDQTLILDKTKTSYYIRTTHGLLKEGNQFTGTPDTSTKYVLNFTSGLDNSAIREILDSANYLVQNIDVFNTGIVEGSGTKKIELYLDELPDGRQWKVEIANEAFRDEAGNYFISKNYAANDNESGWTNLPSNRWFWSGKTAAPVIRVDRVSNNHPTIDPASNTQTGTILSSDEITSRVNVRYRIDCITPDANITYGTIENKTAEILHTAEYNDTARFKPYVNQGHQNSETADASSLELNNIPLLYPYTSPVADYLTIGTGNLLSNNVRNLYTARKDYIAAQATATLYNNTSYSDRGFEGAFKTVVVYRNLNPAIANNSNLKFEGSNIFQAATTIAGFPLTNNDMSGKTSKFAFRRTQEITGGSTTNVDWVWITWEAVCDFYHCSLVFNNNSVINGPIPTADSTWPGDWASHNYRKYGNWGLRVGNWPNGSQTRYVYPDN